MRIILDIIYLLGEEEDTRADDLGNEEGRSC